MNSRIKSTLLIVLFGLLGAISYWGLFKNYAPQASVDLQFNRNEVTSIARKYLKQLGYNADKLFAEADFIFDSGNNLYLETELGLKKAHAVIRADSLHSHYWQVYFFDSNLPPSQMRDKFIVRVSPTSRIIGFEHQIPDTLTLPSVTTQEAQSLVETFLRQKGFEVNRFNLTNSSVKELMNRKDYTYTWASKDSVFRLEQKLTAEVHGDKVGGFRYFLQEPERFRQEGSRIGTYVTYIITASSIATFILLMFIITLFLKKYHDGEVGIKTAVYVFGLLFGLMILEQSLRITTIGFGTTIGDVNRLNTRIIVYIMTVFLVQAFLSAMVFAAWSVGESSARSGWSEKVKAIDGVFNGKIFTLDFANSVIRGYAFGFTILGVVFGVVAMIAGINNFGIFTESVHGIPESYFPSLSAILLALRVALLSEIVFRFFFVSWLREKTGKIWPGLLLSSLLWTLVAFILWDFPVGYLSFYWLFPTYFLFSVVLGFILIKFDLLTAIFTNFTVLAFSYAIPFLASTGSFYQMQSNLFYLWIAVPLGIAVIGCVKKQSFQYSTELIPSHIRRISERERMAKELEIARNVQMSLLPKENPLVEGFDIAGVCLPALEVGGDYYDFFHLGNSKIGIAIGDVSGKGVPAAIYMTLTKGILQSHAGESLSPREVLQKLNKQMYQNIDKSSFVSLFYAVLDMNNRKIRFARAGHNPAILAHGSISQNTLLEPKGIAVGLEAGKRFQDNLEEHEVSLHSGDVLTFYTDGFTEASTKEGEEFGEDRLEKVISEYKFVSANMIIQNVVRSVKSFVGNHPQHDDMTMVVVKVL